MFLFCVGGSNDFEVWSSVGEGRAIEVALASALSPFVGKRV